jgi:hypothetical protein
LDRCEHFQSAVAVFLLCDGIGAMRIAGECSNPTLK